MSFAQKGRWIILLLALIAASVGAGFGIVSYARDAKYRRMIEDKYVDAPSFLKSGGKNEAIMERIALTQPKPAFNFSLVNLDNTVLTLEDLRGSLVLLGFIYTNCPDVCGVLTQHFRYIQRKFDDLIDTDLVLAFITTDPARDTPERLAAYTKGYEGRWRFLTGSRPELEHVWEEYHVAVVDGKASSGLVYHSFMVALIDRDGMVRYRYIGVVDPEEVIIKDIELLLRESTN